MGEGRLFGGGGPRVSGGECEKEICSIGFRPVTRSIGCHRDRCTSR